MYVDLAGINFFELFKTAQLLETEFRTLPGQHFWDNRCGKCLPDSNSVYFLWEIHRKTNISITENFRRQFGKIRIFQEILQVHKVILFKVGIPLLRKPLCISSKETADLLAEEFHSKYSLETYGSFLETIVSNKNSLSTITTTEAAIKESLKEIATRQVSNACIEEITTHIFWIPKSSFEEATLPCQWLTANLTPIYKKGDKFALKNFQQRTRLYIYINR